jgi:hypothetical protein
MLLVERRLYWRFRIIKSWCFTSREIPKNNRHVLGFACPFDLFCTLMAGIFSYSDQSSEPQPSRTSSQNEALLSYNDIQSEAHPKAFSSQQLGQLGRVTEHQSTTLPNEDHHVNPRRSKQRKNRRA